MKLKWPKRSFRGHAVRAVQDVLYGNPVLRITRSKFKLGKRPCPDRDKVLEAFSDWASITAKEAIRLEELTEALLETRTKAYRMMTGEQVKVCSDWTVRHGSNSIADIADEALRQELKSRNVEIIDE